MRNHADIATHNVSRPPADCGRAASKRLLMQTEVGFPRPDFVLRLMPGLMVLSVQGPSDWITAAPERRAGNLHAANGVDLLEDVSGKTFSEAFSQSQMLDRAETHW
jgi:hypothetical protein